MANSNLQPKPGIEKSYTDLIVISVNRLEHSRNSTNTSEVKIKENPVI